MAFKHLKVCAEHLTISAGHACLPLTERHRIREWCQ